MRERKGYKKAAMYNSIRIAANIISINTLTNIFKIKNIGLYYLHYLDS